LINDVNKELKKSKNKFAVFAHDISLWAHSKNNSILEKKLQKGCNLLENYASKWGMKKNEKKNTVIANNHNRASYPLSSNLQLTINNTQIMKSTHPTVLGITLDPGLTFKHHFDTIKQKCNSKIRLIQTLSSKH